MRTHNLLRFVMFGALVALLAGTALAQAGHGIARMAGVVLDKAGNPVVGAVVKITFDQTGGSTFEATTNKKGEFGFMGLGTGGYVVNVTAKGYRSFQTSFRVSQIEKNPKLTVKLDREAGGSGFVQNEASFQVLDQANQFYKDEKYDTALVMYQEFLDKNPGAYQVTLNIGDCYREKGDYDKAVENYNKLVEHAKTDPAMGKTIGAKGLAAIGLCYLKQNKIAESQDYFKRSIEMAPQDENLPYNVAEVYFSNQQIDEAVRYYEMAIQIKPDWPDPFLRLAYAYLNKGDMAKAAENLEKFIKLEPDSERAAQAKNILATIKK
ncbi:MAG TPA: tetratricopeptide repeat protein [Terriglobales bacterium]|nr:tetratricopeptide repeat protein [Terriglobales bacterium]